MISKKIKMLLSAEAINVVELAKRTNTSPQNLYNKLTRDNFKVSELQEYADALEATLEITFITKDGVIIK